MDRLVASGKQREITKLCTKCRKTKPASEVYFPRDPKGVNGLRADCRDCRRQADAGQKRLKRAGLGKGIYQDLPLADAPAENDEPVEEVIEVPKEIDILADRTPRGTATQLKTKIGVIIPDTHVPAHHRRAFSCALAIIHEIQPDFGVIIGDFATLESLSRFPKNTPDLIKYQREIYAVNHALDAIQDSSPNTTWDFLEGNHEHRSVKYKNAFGTIDGLMDFPVQIYINPDPENYHRSQSKLRGMKYIPMEAQPLIKPFASFFHGDPFASKYFTSVIADTYTPAKAAGLPTFSGHMHTFACTQSKIKGYSQCVGFLGDETNVEFQSYVQNKPTGWELGFVIVEVAPNNQLSYTPVHISKTGTAVYGGRMFIGKSVV